LGKERGGGELQYELGEMKLYALDDGVARVIVLVHLDGGEEQKGMCARIAKLQEEKYIQYIQQTISSHKLARKSNGRRRRT
jgi:hypothetical protein